MLVPTICFPYMNVHAAETDIQMVQSNISSSTIHTTVTYSKEVRVEVYSNTANLPTSAEEQSYSSSITCQPLCIV